MMIFNKQQMIANPGDLVFLTVTAGMGIKINQIIKELHY